MVPAATSGRAPRETMDVPIMVLSRATARCTSARQAAAMDASATRRVPSAAGRSPRAVICPLSHSTVSTPGGGATMSRPPVPLKSSR
eukprot:7383336-Prymnesium_polylepis.2